MGKRTVKSTKKFAASGQLKKTIQARRKHQDIRRKAERRQSKKGKGNPSTEEGAEEGEDDDVNDEK